MFNLGNRLFIAKYSLLKTIDPSYIFAEKVAKTDSIINVINMLYFIGSILSLEFGYPPFNFFYNIVMYISFIMITSWTAICKQSILYKEGSLDITIIYDINYLFQRIHCRFIRFLPFVYRGYERISGGSPA